MRKAVKIRELTLGEGMPKICIPVTLTDHETIVTQIRRIGEEFARCADFIELRVDFFEYAEDIQRTETLLRDVREAAGAMPVLFTFRTAGEGGEKDIAEDQYKALLSAAIETGNIDAVDIEAMHGEETAEELIRFAHEKHVAVIASNHDFEKTPSGEEMLCRLKKMEGMGADVAKIAVMPKSSRDVAVLFDVLTKAQEELTVPVIAISMGRLGAVSRIAGEVFGSAVTFAVADKASAPGQLAAEGLKKILELLHG